MSISGITSDGNYYYDYSLQNKSTDQAEHEERAKQMASRMLADLDADEDGNLSVSEIGVDESLIAEADSDGDGLLSESELIVLLSSMGPPSMMGGPQGGQGGPPPDAEEQFSQTDTDGDGTITEEEFPAARPDDVTEEMASEMWGSLNSEGAESLTQEEFSAAMRAQGPPPGGAPGPAGADSAGNASTILGNSSDAEDETELDMNAILAKILTNYGQDQYQQSMDNTLISMMSTGSGLNANA